jgi:hypothetical protein
MATSSGAASYTTSWDTTQLNVEFKNISLVTEELRLAIMDVRRSDGALKNGIVTLDSLAPLVRALAAPGAEAIVAAGEAGAEASVAALEAAQAALEAELAAALATSEATLSAAVEDALSAVGAIQARVSSSPRVVGLKGGSNATLPYFAVDIEARSLTLLNPADGTTKAIHFTGVKTAQLAVLANPFQNLHVYFVWGAVPGLTAIISTALTEPTLTGGNTHYVYALSLRADGDGKLMPGLSIRGNKVWFSQFPYQIACNDNPVLGELKPVPKGEPADLPFWNWVPDDADDFSIWWDVEAITNGAAGTVNLGFLVFGPFPIQMFIPPSTHEVQNVIAQHPVNSLVNVQYTFLDSAGYSKYVTLYVGFQLQYYTVPNGS